MELPPGRRNDVGLGVSGLQWDLGAWMTCLHGREGAGAHRVFAAQGESGPSAPRSGQLCMRWPQRWGEGMLPLPEATGHDSGHTSEAPMILGHAAWQWVGWGGRAPWGAGIHPHAPGPAGGQSTVGQDQREERARSQVGRGDGAPLPQESQHILVFWSWKTSGSKATPVNPYVEAATPGPQNTTSSGNRVSAGSVNHYLRGSHAGVGWVPNPMTGIPMKRDK